MNKYCGSALTVKRLTETSAGDVHVFVCENGYWWRDKFIAYIDGEQYEAATTDELMALLMPIGGC